MKERVLQSLGHPKRETVWGFYFTCTFGVLLFRVSTISDVSLTENAVSTVFPRRRMQTFVSPLGRRFRVSARRSSVFSVAVLSSVMMMFLF